MPKENGGWGLKSMHVFCLSLVTENPYKVLTKRGLWREILDHKYISPCTFLDWIRNPRKSIRIVSNQWKALV
jgi:hypothetical protein